MAFKDKVRKEKRKRKKEKRRKEKVSPQTVRASRNSSFFNLGSPALPFSTHSLDSESQ